MERFGRASANLSYKVQLFISCRQLKDVDYIGVSDPICFLYCKNQSSDTNWVLTDQTEEIKDNLNPEFEKSFNLTYYFEKHQPLKFVVQDVDGKDKYDFIGSAETTLGTVMGSKN